MADIFDEIELPQPAPSAAPTGGGDIFDTIEPPKTDGDIFDTVAETNPDIPEVARITRGEGFRSELTQRMQDAKLFPSFTSAAAGAADKTIRRGAEGKWDLPIMAPLSDNAVINSIGGMAVNVLGQKTGARLDDAGFAVDKDAVRGVFDSFQSDNNLSDEEMQSVWMDLVNRYRPFEREELFRIQSDGSIEPNQMSSGLLDTEAATTAIEASGASDVAKRAMIAQLPQIQEAVAENKAKAIEAFAEGDDSFRTWLARRSADVATGGATFLPRLLDGDRPEFERTGDIVGDVAAFEKLIEQEPELREKLRAVENDLGYQGLGKVGQQFAGLAGAAGSQGAAEAAGTMGERMALAAQGGEDLGLLGDVLKEAPSVGAQILLTKGAGRVLPKVVSPVATFTMPGLQSAGLTLGTEYQAAIEDGASPDEALSIARGKAAKAGVNTALITSMFGTGRGGAVERMAAGKGIANATIRDLTELAGREGIGAAVRSPGFRKVLGDIVLDVLGEATEEGLDELSQAFINADPDTNLSDALDNAIHAGLVGGVIGGTVSVSQSAVARAQATQLEAGASDKAPDAVEAAQEIQPEPVVETPDTDVSPTGETEVAPETEGATLTDETPAPTGEEAAEQTTESGAAYTPYKSPRGYDKKRWTRTRWGRRVGDTYDQGHPEKVVNVDDKSTPGMPEEYVHDSISNVLNGDKGEIEIERRDMTPEEIAAKRAKMERDNAKREAAGFEPYEIPDAPAPAKGAPKPPAIPVSLADLRVRFPNGLPSVEELTEQIEALGYSAAPPVVRRAAPGSQPEGAATAEDAIQIQLAERLVMAEAAPATETVQTPVSEPEPSPETPVTSGETPAPTDETGQVTPETGQVPEGTGETPTPETPVEATLPEPPVSEEAPETAPVAETTVTEPSPQPEAAPTAPLPEGTAPPETGGAEVAPTVSDTQVIESQDQLSGRKWSPNSVVFGAVSFPDYGGLGVVEVQHDGTPEGIARARDEAERLANEQLGEVSHSGSFAGATDAEGNVVSIVSPSGKVNALGTPEGEYAKGNLNAFRDAALQDILDAKERGDLDTAESLIDDQVQKIEEKKAAKKKAVARDEAELKDIRKKLKAGTPVSEIDPRFDSGRGLTSNYTHTLKALKGHLAEFDAEIAKWESLRTPRAKTSQPPAAQPQTPVEATLPEPPVSEEAPETAPVAETTVTEPSPQPEAAPTAPLPEGTAPPETGGAEVATPAVTEVPVGAPVPKGMVALPGVLPGGSQPTYVASAADYEAARAALVEQDMPRKPGLIDLQNIHSRLRAGDTPTEAAQWAATEARAHAAATEAVNAAIASGEIEPGSAASDLYSRVYNAPKPPPPAAQPQTPEAAAPETPTTPEVGQEAAPTNGQNIGQTPPETSKIPTEPPPLPAEAAPTDEFTLGIKKAKLNEARARLGLKPLDPNKFKGDEKLLAQAFDELARDPEIAMNRAKQTAAEAKKGKEYVTNYSPQEVVTANLYHAQEQVEIEKLKEQWQAANLAGDKTRADTINQEIDRRLVDLDAWERNLHIATSSAGAAFRELQPELQEDYSFAGLSRTYQAKIKKDGTPLTPEETAKLAAAADTFRKEASTLNLMSLADAMAEAGMEAEAERLIAVAERIDEMAKEAEENLAKSRKQITAPKRAKIKKKLNTAAEAARKRLEEQGWFGGTPKSPTEGGEDVLMSGLDPQTARNIRDAATIMGVKFADKVIDGTLSLQEFTVGLIETFGEKVRPFSERIYEETKKLGRKYRGEETVTEEPASLEETLDEVDGDLDEPTRKDVTEVAKLFIAQGKTGLEVMELTHAALEPKFPDLTRETVETIFTGYGTVRTPDQSPNAKELRRIKELAREHLKQLDLEQGKLAKLTGYLRDDTDPEVRQARKKVRELTKKVEEDMRKLGIDVPSDTQRQKTGLQTLKRQMANEIAELRAALRTGEPLVTVTRNGVVMDEDATKARKRLDVLRKLYERTFPPAAKTHEQKVEAAIKTLDRQIAEEQKMIAAGVAKRPAGESITSPEIEARREQLAELRATRRALDPENSPLEQAKRARATANEKLQQAIDTSNLAARRREQIDPDAELQALVNVGETLRDEIREMRKALSSPENPTAFAERTKKELATAEKRLAEVERMVEEGDIAVRNNRAPKATDPAVSKVRNKIKEANRRIATMRREAMTDEERAKGFKKNIDRRIADLQRRVREGDTSPRTKKPKPLNHPIAKQARIDYQNAVDDYNEFLLEEMEKNMTLDTKAWIAFVDGLTNLQKTLLASTDISGFGKQGLKMIVSNPKLALSNYGKNFRWSNKLANETDEAIRNDPDFDAWIESGGQYKSWRPGADATSTHELYRSRLAHKIPVIKTLIGGSEKGYVTYLNSVAFAHFKMMKSKLDKEGAATKDNLVMIADVGNMLTGTSSLRGGWEKHAPALGILFWAPKFLFSQFEAIKGVAYSALDASTGFRFGDKIDTKKGRENTRVARKLMAVEHAKMTVGYIALGALLKSIAAGLDQLDDGEDNDSVGLSLDPRSTDFMKLRWGERRVDFGGGLLQALVFGAQWVTGEVKRADGTIENIADMPGFGNDRTRGSITARFARSKLSPVVGAGVNLLTRTNYIGEPVYIEDELVGSYIPLPIQEYYEALRQSGFTEATIATILSVHGFTSSQYGPRTEAKYDSSLSKDLNEAILFPAVNLALAPFGKEVNPYRYELTPDVGLLRDK